MIKFYVACLVGFSSTALMFALSLILYSIFNYIIPIKFMIICIPYIFAIAFVFGWLYAYEIIDWIYKDDRGN